MNKPTTNMDNTNIEEKMRYISRGAVEIITPGDLRYKLEKSEREKRSLVVKYGVDPTAPEIHLGHLVPIRKLRHFQDIGHDVTFLIGDFTARIGDPSGRTTERKPMTEEEVLSNAETYKEQIFKILIPEMTRIVYNSKWLKPITLEKAIQLLSFNTVNNLIKRKNFAGRIEQGLPVAGHEIIYPFLQAYDSVALNADIELGGTDQYFNLIFGRDLQPKYGQEPQVVITTPLLEGLDGNEKMSKSLGNTVGINEPPNQMYAKIMKVRDNLIGKYFELLTNIDYKTIGKMETEIKSETLNPMVAKKMLAKEITSSLHSPKKAKAAEEEFIRVYSKGELPNNITEYKIRKEETKNGFLNAVELMRYCNLAESNSDARRLVQQRGFSIDNIIIEDPYKPVELTDGLLLKVGKRKFAQIKYDEK